MAERQNFRIRDRLKSFRYAWDGIKAMYQTEHNLYIHTVLTVLAFLLAFLFKVPRVEIIALVIVSGMVWVAEIFNTVIEKIMDFITTEKHPLIKKIKDMAAAAVLLTAIIAVIVGGLIFIPKIFY
ncbi:MAG TPA: diacylglycerol kinase family protein [Chitinophagaceae bacterium]